MLNIIGFVSVEGRFLDAPADDLSVGVFQCAVLDGESEFDVLTRALSGAKVYGLDPQSLKIDL